MNFGGDAEDWKSGSYSDDDDEEEDAWASSPEEEGAPKKSLRIILRVNKSRLPESPAQENGIRSSDQPHTNGSITQTNTGEGAVNGNGIKEIHKAEQRTEIDILPDAPAVTQSTTNSTG